MYTSLYVVDRPLLAVENRTMWYFLKGKTPHHMHKKTTNMPYTTTSPITHQLV